MATIRTLRANLEAGGATRFKRDMLASAAAMKKFRGAAAGVTSALGSMGTTMAIATGALAAYAGTKGLVAATKASIEFENATAELAKILGDVRARAAASEVRDLSNELPVARDELLRVAAAAARMGVRGTKNIRSFTRVMAEVGVATDESAQQAATSLARMAKITETPITRMRNLASAMNELSNTMELGFSEVRESATKAAAGLAPLGLQADEIAALAAQTTTLSTSAARAGTRLKSLGALLQSPKKQAELAEVLGMTAEHFQQLVERDPSGVILRLARTTRVGGQRARELSDVLGRRIGPVIGQLSQDIPGLEEAFRTSNKAMKEGTSLGEEFARFVGITSSRGEILSNILGNIATTIGKPIREGLKSMANGLINVAQQGDNIRTIGKIFAAIAQTIVTGVRAAFNVLEILVTSVATAAISAFGHIANAVNTFIIRPINSAAEAVGVGFRLATLDAAGAFAAAQRGTHAVWQDTQDILDTSQNLVSSVTSIWQTQDKVATATSKAADKSGTFRENMEGAATATAKVAEKFQEIFGVPLDVRRQAGRFPPARLPGVMNAGPTRLGPGRNAALSPAGGATLVNSLRRSAQTTVGPAEKAGKELKKLGGLLSDSGSSFKGVGNVLAQSVLPAMAAVTNASDNMARALLQAAGGILQALSRLKSVPGPVGVAGGILGAFAGFFHRGGTIPGGQFGLVGESGPEFVAGPATVSPGGFTVTVDASGLPPAKTPFEAARDQQWQALLDESARVNRQSGGEL